MMIAGKDINRRMASLGGTLLVAMLPGLMNAAHGADQPTVRGQVSAVNSTILAAPLSGRLLEVNRRVGEEVNKGDVLVRFDCRSLKAERAVASARLSGASSQYKVNKQLARYDNVSQLDVDLSRAAVNEASSSVNLSDVYLSDCTITAPFDAEVVSRAVNPHQFVSNGEPMLELVSSDELEIEAVIPAMWLGQVDADTPMTFTADATGAELAGKIVRVVDNIDPVSQTLKVIARPDAKPDGGIKPGMSGEVRFPSLSPSTLEDVDSGEAAQ
ncbi:efflux RND transporter periplasmic adaptor subunit [Cobetia amphilecti]|uniref:efflux RND transporter periplasmic adaptor subunit n=1 Tax=Cobetia amphilecti TaxID=1055104 RepID=UPI002446CD0D|nr:efflux RND transporter periplasmic adaptor subunit [Cobetia litoralis]MDH2421979.1 efflux RND transporter periplasmic adaptor subunit [Cobetia litoralis]